MPAGLANTPSAELEYIVLTDFTPGITKKGFGLLNQSEPQTRQQNQVAAQEGNYVTGYTYGCYGDPDGGLRPLPRVTEQLTYESASESAAPTSAGRVYVVDAAVVSPTLPSDSADASHRGPWALQQASSNPLNAEEVYAILAYRSNATFANQAITLLRRFRPGSVSTLVTSQVQSSADGTVGTDDYQGVYNTDGMIPGGGIALSRSGNAEDWDVAVLPGTDPPEYIPDQEAAWIVQAVWSMGYYHSKLAVYPDPTHFQFPYTTQVFTQTGTSGGLFFLSVIAHQDRLVYLPEGEPFFSGGGIRPFGAMGKPTMLAAYDALYYSALLLAVRDYSSVAGTTNYGASVTSDDHLIASADSPSGIGVMGSINSGELIAIRNAGGGFSVRGAMESPTVVKLPGMQGVQGANNFGVMTPLGFVYGSRAGVFLWNGGDQSKCISPQLDGWFWDVNDQTAIGTGRRLGSRGRFGWLHPFVWAPNNYVMDSRSGGWWRTTKPEVAAEVPGGTSPTFRHMHYQSTAWGRMYAFRSSCNYEETVLADIFDPNYGARKYSFVSQPIPLTLNREIKVREVVFTVSGAGTIALTIRQSGSGGNTYNLTVPTNTFTKRYRLTVNEDLTDMNFTVVADSGNDNVDAPVIHQISFGYRADRSVAQANA